MQTIFIEGVRAFRQRVEAPLRKLTILVGPNSTGKSTFLSAIRTAWDIAVQGQADFNEQPFELGTFDSIAHYHGGKGKRVTEFEIGAEFPLSAARKRQRTLPGMENSSALRVEGTFRQDHGSPILARFRASDGKLRIDLFRREGKLSGTLVNEKGEEETFEAEVPGDLPLPVALRYMYATQRERNAKQPSFFYYDLFHLIGMSRPYALAPVRSRPQRTYDPIRDRPSPEGEHVPALLSRLHAQGGDQWDTLSNALNAFGKESGMFSDVSVRSLGKKQQQGEPFQIQVKIPGQIGRRNLLDVGYGVSQVLPILVETVLGGGQRMLLVQQPEVHLHPSAQAALGTYLARSAGSDAARYVVETHSDYLVDRVAMAIRDSNHPLSAEDVSLLFFQPTKAGVAVDPIQLSQDGQPIKPPRGYREFFLAEQARILGIND